MWRLVIQALPLWLSVVEGQSPVNGTVSVPFNQRTTEQLYFGISLELGKPPQRVSFAIAPCCSTDSSWTVDRNANYTNGSTTGFPDPFGKPFTFDADASSSLQRRKDSVSSGYGFNTSFEGHKVQDVVALGNVTSDGDFLYLAEESNRVPGDISFDDISRWLKDGSHTDQSVYRIWLNGPDSAPGEVLFGGLDTEKLQGDLNVHYRNGRLDFLGESTRNIYNLSAVTIADGDVNLDLMSNHSDASFEVDHSDYLTWIPPDAFEALAGTVGEVQVVNYTDKARKYSIVQAVLVPCTKASSSAALTIMLGTAQANTSLVLPLSALVSGRDSARAQRDLLPDVATATGPDLCLFYVAPGDRSDFFVAEHSVFRLGAMALRGLYTVFDRENTTLATAPARANVTEGAPANVVRYNEGCVAGARYDNASMKPTCTAVATLLPTSLFSDAPTSITASASASSTSTSAAIRAELRSCCEALGLLSIFTAYIIF